MQYFMIFMKLVPFIFSLVKAAETAFSKEKVGPEKKAAVKTGITAVFDGANEVSTGGQKETFESIKPLFDSVIDKAIDLAAMLLFKI